jgi:hypothetical protein
METFDFIFDFDFDFVTDRGRLHHQRASVRIIFPEVPHENDQLRANGICHVSKRTTAAAAGPLSRRLLIPHTEPGSGPPSARANDECRAMDIVLSNVYLIAAGQIGI